MILFYTDQELDKESGLYNYDARMYDPIVGRFVSADSILPDVYDPQKLDRYAYSLNNPIKYTDPSGHFVFMGTLGAIAAYKAAIVTINVCSAVIVGLYVAEKLDDVQNTDSQNPPKENSDQGSSSDDQGKRTGRGRNKLGPDPQAQGDHSSYRTDDEGRVTNYETYEGNPQNPTGYDTTKRVDTQYSKPHSEYNKKTKKDVPTPHTHTKDTPGGVREAEPGELPGNGEMNGETEGGENEKNE